MSEERRILLFIMSVLKQSSGRKSFILDFVDHDPHQDPLSKFQFYDFNLINGRSTCFPGNEHHQSHDY